MKMFILTTIGVAELTEGPWNGPIGRFFTGKVKGCTLLFIYGHGGDGWRPWHNDPDCLPSRARRVLGLKRSEYAVNWLLRIRAKTAYSSEEYVGAGNQYAVSAPKNSFVARIAAANGVYVGRGVYASPSNPNHIWIGGSYTKES